MNLCSHCRTPTETKLQDVITADQRKAIGEQPLVNVCESEICKKEILKRLVSNRIRRMLG